MNIENLNIDIDLLKFDSACVVTLKGKSSTKRCVAIPIEDNDIYVSADEQTGKAKAAYLHLTAWKSREERFGQTHYVTQSLSQEYKEAHPEASQNKPILGNGKPVKIESNNAAGTVNAPNVPLEENNDDLPF